VHDEFDAPRSSREMVRETGGNGWGNASSSFTRTARERAIEGGNLVIEARRETFGTRDYTSAA